MVVMLHGAGQDADDFAGCSAMNSAAQRHGFLVLYPAQLQRKSANRCWNWYEASHQHREAGDPARLAMLTLQIAHEFQVDRFQIYVAGLSAGGAMAALLGELFPDIYAAVGVHSGLAARAGTDLSSALTAMRGREHAATRPSGVPTIVFHGDRDSVVHPINGNQVIAAAVGSNCLIGEEQGTSNGRSYTRLTFGRGGARTSVRAEHWIVHGADHAWSGGSDAGSFGDPLGPNASDAMLKFFQGERLTSNSAAVVAST